MKFCRPPPPCYATGYESSFISMFGIDVSPHHTPTSVWGELLFRSFNCETHISHVCILGAVDYGECEYGGCVSVRVRGMD